MSDEVSDFLRSVELLKERREEEDEARSRELEEKILQEKKERQARRAGTPIHCQSATSPLHSPTLQSIKSGRKKGWRIDSRAMLYRASASWNTTIAPEII
jgi:hypothetical protein